MLESLDPKLRKKTLSALCKICGRQAFLPRSLQIPFNYDHSSFPLRSGGCADVWMGEHQGRNVAVKVLRLSMSCDLNKFISVGYSLDSPDVYPGADCDRADVLQGGNDVEKPPSSKRAPVSGCADDEQPSCNGIRMDGQWQYKSVHQGQSRRKPVRACGASLVFLAASSTDDDLRQLKDVTRGLIYMHSQGMIHGDLKGVRFRSLVMVLPPTCFLSRTMSWLTKTVVHAWRTSDFSPSSQIQLIQQLQAHLTIPAGPGDG